MGSTGTHRRRPRRLPRAALRRGRGRRSPPGRCTGRSWSASSPAYRRRAHGASSTSPPAGAQPVHGPRRPARPSASPRPASSSRAERTRPSPCPRSPTPPSERRPPHEHHDHAPPLADRDRRRPDLLGRLRGPRWGHQLDRRLRAPRRCARSGSWPPSSAPTASCRTTRSPRRRPSRRRVCVPSASSCRSCSTTRRHDPLPEVEPAMAALVAARASTVVVAAATGAEGYDAGRCSTTPSGTPSCTTSTAIDGGRRGARPRRDPAPARRHAGRVGRGDRAGARRAAASGCAWTPATCSSAAATRSRSPAPTPTASATCTSRTSRLDIARAGPRRRAHLHRRRGARDVRAARRGRRRRRRHRRRARERRLCRVVRPRAGHHPHRAARGDRGRPGGRRPRLHRAHPRRRLAGGRRRDRGRSGPAARRRAPRLRPRRHGAHGRRRLPAPARRGPGGRPHLREVPRRERDQRRRRRRPARPLGRASSPRSGDDPFGRYVRREAERLGRRPGIISVSRPTARRRRSPSARSSHRTTSRSTSTGTRRPPTCSSRRPSSRRRDPRRPGLLGDGHRPVPGALPRRALRGLAGPGAHARTPSSTSTTGRCSGPTRREAREQVGEALEHVTVAVGNREECEVAVGETDPHRAADALLERGLELAVVKQGPQGRARRDARRAGRGRSPSRSRSSTASAPVTPSAAPSSTACSTGWDLRRILAFANVAGAIVAGRLECSTAMPTTDEVEAALAGARRVRAVQVRAHRCRDAHRSARPANPRRIAAAWAERARRPLVGATAACCSWPPTTRRGRARCARRRDGDGQPVRPARPARRRARAPRRRRRAGHPRRPRRPRSCSAHWRTRSSSAR